MLGKEAFALLVTRVWNMLSDNEKFSADVSTSVNKLKPKAFRENVARSVLQAMTSAVGRTLTPRVEQSGKDFIETVAFAFAYVSEDGRPPKFTGYTPHTFAEMLIVKFCTSYAELDAGAPTNDAIHKCPVKIVIPTTSPAAILLSERIRAMPTAEFGKYPIKN
ncbi:MAG: hypothetical protein AAB424_02000 [Patescibacteria group bacterium]